MSEIYTNHKGQSFELTMWDEIKKDCGYTDNNKGYIYGCHHIDEEGQIIDCNWFKTNDQRINFLDNFEGI